MTTDEKLAAILAAVQVDPGNRGLARDPHDNLFTACPGDFAAACGSIVEHRQPIINIITGFRIPACNPPTHETDGPLGTLFLVRAFRHLNISTLPSSEMQCSLAMESCYRYLGITEHDIVRNIPHDDALFGNWVRGNNSEIGMATHIIGLERVGPATNARYHTMRGRDITDLMLPTHHMFQHEDKKPNPWTTIGIGDGGNEIGMGKIPHETIVKNIPNGDLIHCRVPVDYLIVAGVSNWGAYALAAGVFVLRGEKPPSDLFDPDVEKRILEIMVREGPLVDGVTGEQTATVDGLTWNDYIQPMLKMREILEID